LILFRHWNFPKLATLLEYAEEWFPILKVSAVAIINFSSIKENAYQYCEAVKLVQKTSESCSFTDYRTDERVFTSLRQ